jgi:hypothetical protein
VNQKQNIIKKKPLKSAKAKLEQLYKELIRLNDDYMNARTDLANVEGAEINKREELKNAKELRDAFLKELSDVLPAAAPAAAPAADPFSTLNFVTSPSLS